MHRQRQSAPYEFGVKVSVVTPLERSSGGQFVAHVAALPGNPYDGHTLGTVIPAMEQMIGDTIERALTDAGYRPMRRPVTSSRSTPPARSVALHRRSNASSSGVLRSSP